jgi:hypothetical protein
VGSSGDEIVDPWRQVLVPVGEQARKLVSAEHYRQDRESDPEQCGSLQGGADLGQCIDKRFDVAAVVVTVE